MQNLDQKNTKYNAKNKMTRWIIEHLILGLSLEASQATKTKILHNLTFFINKLLFSNCIEVC